MMHTNEKSKFKIFIIGLPKTGTTSMARWFNDVGYNHRPWLRSYDLGLLALIDKEFLYREADKFDSFDDMPWCKYYQYLAEHYPNAKFILTLRKDEFTWWDSFYNHALRAGPNEVDALWYEGVPIIEENSEYFINLYLQHRKLVNDYFRSQPHRIIEYKVGEDDIKTLHGFMNIQSSKTKIPLTLENAGDKWSDYQILDNLIGKGKRTTALNWCMKARTGDKDLLDYWESTIIRDLSGNVARKSPGKYRIRLYSFMESCIRNLLRL